MKRLSPRQMETIRLKAAGHGLEEIAAKMGISPWTAKRHLSIAYDRLGVGTAEEAYAALGWLSVPEAQA